MSFRGVERLQCCIVSYSLVVAGRWRSARLIGIIDSLLAVVTDRRQVVAAAPMAGTLTLAGAIGVSSGHGTHGRRAERCGQHWRGGMARVIDGQTLKQHRANHGPARPEPEAEAEP